MVNYPRNRRGIVVINGIFDDFSDTTFSATRWFKNSEDSAIATTYPASAGGVGGNSMKIRCLSQEAEVNTLRTIGGRTPYVNVSNQGFINPSNHFYWKSKAEFRLRIIEDVATTDSGEKTRCSNGFILDGGVAWYLGGHPYSFNRERIGVWFNVADQIVGIAGGGTLLSWTEHYTQAWAGAINTWYDIKVEWSYNWFLETDWNEDPVSTIQYINVKVYQNGSLLFSTNINLDDWRDDDNQSVPDPHIPLGRSGPAVMSAKDGSFGSGWISAEYKDVLMSTDVGVLNWSYKDSIVMRGAERSASVLFTANRINFLIHKGDDLQIYTRNSKTDDWTAAFRGIIRETDSENRRVLLVKAEGYDSSLAKEKSENLSFTTQTAGVIVDAAINNPKKWIYNTSTYFDSTSATYSKDYPHTFKLDIIEEMAVAENFLLFLDAGNNWHFQSIRTNDTDIFLKNTQSNIYKIKQSQIMARSPNFIRVIGTGVYAEAEISSEVYTDASKVVRSFSRLDLTTQAEVESALDHYIDAVRKPIRILNISMKPDHRLQRGKNIQVSLPDIGIFHSEFIVLNLDVNAFTMQVSLIENQPQVISVIAELGSRTDVQESKDYPSDLITTANDQLKKEGLAELLVSAYYRIYYPNSGSPTIIAEGEAMVTDNCMDYILAVLNEETPTAPSYIAWGDGTTTLVRPSDTSLDNQLGRVNSTRSLDAIKKMCIDVPLAVEYKLVDLSVSHTLINISEIGLWDASSGGNLFVRATFPTEAVYEDDTTIIIWFKVHPVSSGCYVNRKLTSDLLTIMQSGSGSFNFAGIAPYFTGAFMVPNPMLVDCSDYDSYGNMFRIPIEFSGKGGTFTITKYSTKNLIRYYYTGYTIDKADLDGIPQPPGVNYGWYFALGLGEEDPNYDFFYVGIFDRTQINFDDMDGQDLDVKIFIQLKRGDMNPFPQLSFEEL